VGHTDFNIDQPFPLVDVTMCLADKTLSVKDPLQAGTDWQASQNEFALQMKGVGDFYARNGNYVEYSPSAGADPDWVQLILKSRILVALLHQRKILSFHASSFILNGMGVMILGETGAGKSSLTAAFAMNGEGFLSDDLTPVMLKSSGPCIWPISRAIKISEDTVRQLNISRMKLKAAENGTDKHYLFIRHAGVKDYNLDTILKIETGNVDKPEFFRPEPTVAFSLLRSEICSSEILSGMPDTEIGYLHTLLEIIRKVDFIQAVRPVEIEIQRLSAAIANYIQTGH
jgi:hypothetical protein